MKKWFAQFGSSDKEREDSVYDIHPDLAKAFIDAIRNRINVQGPHHAQDFDDLTATIAQTSRLIQHLEAFRELAITAADRTSPHADRKAIAIAAGMPPSRLYRVLEKHGRPKNRSKAYEQAVHEALDKGLEGDEMWNYADRATE
ncbi:hypothetical protein ACFV10_28355 [Streptomyces cyaneofuscatus]|uniref:hypothetical protein n=1 Tax=Streptomyces cyaneofuscatus TaxID=66883 RepID=UPI00368B18EB